MWINAEGLKSWLEGQLDECPSEDTAIFIEHLIEICDSRIGPLEKRREAFKKELMPHVPKYGKKIITEFYLYWTEEDRNRKPKMRYEKEKTWNLDRRLDRWEKRNNGI